MSDSFENRLDFKGTLDEAIARSVADYAIGALITTELITMGFQDYNVRADTDEGSFLIKIFSKSRDRANNERYVNIMQAALAAGVNHPELFKDKAGDALHTDIQSGLSMAIMRFIRGKTFYDLQAPNDEQLQLIATEAVKINAITYAPPYLFDSWAIPNMQWMYNQTREHLTGEGVRLLNKAFEYYRSIPIDILPTCFVHGDIIKPNAIAAEDGKIYILDFAVANVYPRIQELAVMVANLMFDGKVTLQERVDKVVEAYLKAGGELTEEERANVFNYALPGAAMEYMGSVYEKKIAGDTSDEIDYWERLGLESLREALGNI